MALRLGSPASSGRRHCCGPEKPCTRGPTAPGRRPARLPSSARWPTRRRRSSRSTSSSRRSGPSLPGSVITFDPEQLEFRVAELEQELGTPGFWDDQQHAAQVSAEHARLTRRLERYRRLTADYQDAQELLAMDGEMEDEIATSIAPLRAELDRLQEDALFSGEYDAGDALVTIHAGTGGTDAADWTEILLRMYLRWAQTRGFDTELIEASAGEEAGLKSATFTVRGDNAYGILKAERGVHRLVRQSPFDQAHRRHTSFAQVIVSPLLSDDVALEIDEGDLRVDTYRSSGAGGQHVNKTDSAVRITHLPTGVVVQCQNERSQTQNKAMAMQLLRSRLIELEERKRSEELVRQRGEVKDVAWGSQIRSYVMHPYTMVKDHRTEHEVGDVQKVLDGDLDGFVRDYLHKTAAASAS